MKILRFTITFLSLFLLIPIDMMAGDELTFSDFKMNDGDICSMPIEKGKLKVTFKDETVKYNKQLKAIMLPKGTVITISAPKGEIISGLSLRHSGKSSNMKDFFSCEAGKFEHGIWKGTSNRITFRCVKDCNISKIRVSFKTDKPKAYVVWGLSDEFYHLSPNCDYFTNDLLPVLYMCYNERVELIEQYSPIYEYVGKTYLIDENAEAPDWYEKYGSPYSITIESSFINYHPKRTSHWFAGIETQIFGLENLNTSEVTDMSYMFAGFKSNLKYYLYGKGGDYTSFYDSLSKYADPKNNFVYEVLKTLDFSNVKDMNHMFATSIIPFFEMPEIYIPSKVNTNGLFQGCGVKYIKITSNINVNDNFFDGVGTESQPCAIYAPESFDFESISTNSKLFWRGGYFIIPKAEGYAVLTENYSDQDFNGTSDNISLTFYFDDQKYIQEQDSYTFYTQPYGNVLKHYMRKSIYDLNSGYEVPKWLDDVRKKMDQNFEIMELTINFDKSFSSFKPKTTHRWFDFNVAFYSMQEKKIIYGIENLDMSETTIASSMFANWGNMYRMPESVDLSLQDMSNVIHADSMFYNNPQISSIILPNNFSNIGIANSMFYGCSQLTSIHLPKNCTKIGNSAFSGCSSLTSVDIPNSVSRIGDYAFLCTGLSSVTLGSNVSEIGAYAFAECSDLKTVFSLTYAPPKISSYTFPNRFNQILYVPYASKSKYYNTEYWWDFKGIIELEEEIITFADATVKSLCVKNWDTNGDGELSLAEAAAVTSLGTVFRYNNSIASFNELQFFTGLKSIGNEAFSDCYMLTSVTIPNSVKSIGQSAFANCTELTSIGIPYSVTSIGDGAFQGCYCLTSIDIPNSVTSIGDRAFFHCYGLTSLNIPYSVIRIGEYAFNSCGSLKSIKVDVSNSKYDSRDNCNAIIETSSNTLILGCNYTIIPNSVISIGEHAFRGCTGLESVTIPNSVTSIGESAFRGCTGLISIGIPYSVTCIGDDAFENCSCLTSIDIPSSVTSIGRNVFMKCESLTSVTVDNPIPLTIESETFSSISANATLYVPFGSKTAYQTAKYWQDFYNIVEYGDILFADASVKSLCVKNWDTNGDGELSVSEAAAVKSLGTVFKGSKITSFNELQYFTGLTSINEGAFSSSTIKEVTLPESVTSLAKEAFLYCKSLTAIHIPLALTFIGQNALSGCSAMTAITVDKANDAFCDIDGVLFNINKYKKTLVQFPIAKSTNYTVPEGTKSIGTDAFFMSKLVTVTLPASLEEIGYDAFGYSTSLTEVNIPEGVTTFGPYAFDGCSALKDVYCSITTPYAIDKNNFSTKAYSNATLHVLPYLVDTYKNLEGWKYFANIKGDVIDYAVTAEATTINLGETAILPVLVANNGEIDGMQFDFTLPAGVTVAADMVGGFVVTTTDRSNKLTATCAKIADNTYRVILLSINRAIVAAGNGVVLNIQLQCADDVTGGDYDIAFTNVSVSRVEGDKSVNVKVADFTAPLTVVEISKIPGDVDGNFTVDVTDVMIIVDYILNRPCNKFNFANADLDGDGIVNVTDAMNVVNIILHKSNVRVSPTAILLDREILRLGTSETGCQLHTAFDSPQITALQMEVTLLEGCCLNNVSLTGRAAHSHMVKTYQLSDRTYNVVVFSIKGSTLDTDAPFLQLDLEGNGGLVEIENILCTDTNHESLTSPNLSAEVTGITTVTAGNNSDTPVYNLAGQRLAKPRKGINITNGKKVVLK